MPAAFIIAQMTIHDREAFAAYSTSAGESVIKYGGDFLVAGKGRREILEGDGDMPFVAAARFPSYEAALRWYRSPEYAPLIKARQKAAIGRVMLIEGID